jgi:hypothetical protein
MGMGELRVGSCSWGLRGRGLWDESDVLIYPADSAYKIYDCIPTCIEFELPLWPTLCQ